MKKEFTDLITDKRIIFVGPAISMVGSGKKDFIDSYDTVVKTNGWFMIKNNPTIIDDYGKRCDILYINGLTANHDVLNIEPYFKDDLSFIVLKSSKRLALFEEKYGNDISLRVASKKVKGVRRAMMGAILIQDILRHQPKELMVTGIDFYTDPKGYSAPGYEMEANQAVIDEETRLGKNPMSLHGSSSHEYIKLLYRDGAILLDDVVLEKL